MEIMSGRKAKFVSVHAGVLPHGRELCWRPRPGILGQVRVVGGSRCWGWHTRVRLSQSHKTPLGAVIEGCWVDGQDSDNTGNVSLISRWETLVLVLVFLTNNPQPSPQKKQETKQLPRFVCLKPLREGILLNILHSKRNFAHGTLAVNSVYRYYSGNPTSQNHSQHMYTGDSEILLGNKQNVEIEIPLVIKNWHRKLFFF